jgi:hypothetical protein
MNAAGSEWKKEYRCLGSLKETAAVSEYHFASLKAEKPIAVTFFFNHKISGL